MNTCSCGSKKPSIAADELAPMAGIFKALGHPVRLRIVEMLMDGKKCVCELQSDSGRGMSTISSHLNILRTNGLVTSEQVGKNVYYELAFPCLTSVFNCLKTSLNKN